MSSKKKVSKKSWTPNDLPKGEPGKLGDGWYHVSGFGGDPLKLTVYRTFRKITDEEIESGNYFRTEADAESAKEAILEGIHSVFAEFH